MNTEWQPIETAPRDGQSIIVANKETGWVGEASWFEAWYTDESRPGWMIANCDEEYGYYIEATHWMPLPPPPSETMER